MSTAPRIALTVAIAIIVGLLLKSWYVRESDEYLRRQIVEAVRKAERPKQEHCLSLPAKFPIYITEGRASEKIRVLSAEGLLKIDPVEGVRPRARSSGHAWEDSKEIFRLYQMANDAIAKGASRESVSQNLSDLLPKGARFDDDRPQDATIERYAVSDLGEIYLNDEHSSFCYNMDMSLELESFTAPAANSAGLIVTLARFRKYPTLGSSPDWAASDELLKLFPEFDKASGAGGRGTLRLVKTDKGYAPLSDFSTGTQ